MSLRILSRQEIDFVSGGLLPPGYTPYGEGGHYMQDAQGNISLTPEWQQQVDDGEINWIEVAADLALIAGSGVSILGAWGVAIGTVIVAGAGAVNEMAEQQRLEDEQTIEEDRDKQRHIA